jgi:hypothetical protein
MVRIQFGYSDAPPSIATSAPVMAHSHLFVDCGPSSPMTPRWREMDSNLRFRARLVMGFKLRLLSFWNPVRVLPRGPNRSGTGSSNPAAISRPHTRLRSIASANDPMTYVLRAKSPLFARSREIDPPDRLGGGGKEIPPPSSWRVRPNDARFLARNAAARASGGLPASKLLSSLENHRAWPRYRQRCGCVPPRLAPNRASDRSRSHRPAWVRDLARPGVASRCPRLAALVPP